MTIEAMKQALEALEESCGNRCNAEYNPCHARTAITSLRQAIEQAESVEPVAWQVMVEDEAMKEFPIKDMAHDWCVKQKLSGSPYLYWMRPLYTNPPAAQRQHVTDGSLCWCEPETSYTDPETGASVIVHKEPQ